MLAKAFSEIMLDPKQCITPIYGRPQYTKEQIKLLTDFPCNIISVLWQNEKENEGSIVLLAEVFDNYNIFMRSTPQDGVKIYGSEDVELLKLLFFTIQ